MKKIVYKRKIPEIVEQTPDGEQVVIRESYLQEESLYFTDETKDLRIKEALKYAYNKEIVIEDILDERSLIEIQEEKQNTNKKMLSLWLSEHPLLWTDGKYYGVEEQDQNEMALNLMQYQVSKTSGQEAILEWHAQKEQCRQFEEEEYIALSIAISQYVYPYRRYQERVKSEIFNATSSQEIENIVIDYSKV